MICHDDYEQQVLATFADKESEELATEAQDEAPEQE